MASSAKAKCIALVGPTASGKSALSLRVAKQFPCEIISVDSALVYRGMDIGTAKPSLEERALVPHHLIDIIDPAQSYSAAQFVHDATRLVAEIHARGKLALLVGGTMLYLKALVQGMDAMPAASPDIRASIDDEAKMLGWPALHAQLARVDPATAARLSPHDSQRIQRALEVYRASGQPISTFQSTHGAKRGSTSITASINASMAPGQEVPHAMANLPFISLEPESRVWLHERIAQRFEQILQAGLVEEVRQLKSRDDLHLNLPSMRCVGYRQTWEMLNGMFAPAQLNDKAIAATRQLAKRQITWQRSMQPPSYNKHVIAPDSPQAFDDALDLIASWLS